MSKIKDNIKGYRSITNKNLESINFNSLISIKESKTTREIFMFLFKVLFNGDEKDFDFQEFRDVCFKK